MTTIHIVITIFVLFAMSRTFLRLREGEINKAQFAFWFVVWSLVAVVGYWPGVTQNLADFLGIDRGIDSVVYVSIVILFYLVYRAYVKLEHLEQDITKVIREEAISEFSKNAKKD